MKNQFQGSTSPCQGDYMWTRGTEVLGVCIERKTMRDLIGRSAKGDHVRRRVTSGGNVASGNSRPYDQGLLSMVVP